MKRKQVNIHDNAQLCALDMDSATREQRIALLIQIINNELDRGEEADEQLIFDCTELLEELSPETVMPADEVEAHLQAFLTATVNAPAPKAKAHSLPDQNTPRRFHKNLLRIAAVAAMFVMIITLSQVYVYAMVQQDNRLYEDAVNFDASSAKTPSLPYSEVTTKGPYEATYSGLKDFFEYHSHLDFYYPQQLPEERAIDSIYIKYRSADSWIVVFAFKDPTVKHYIAQRLSYPLEPPQTDVNDRIIKISSRKYVTTQTEADGKTIFESVGYYEQIRYTLVTYDYDSTRYFLSQTGGDQPRYDSMEELLADWDYLQDFYWNRQLPDGFSIRYCSIKYNTQPDWRITVVLDGPSDSPNNIDQTLTISPVTDDTADDFKNRSPIFSNERTAIYIKMIGHGSYIFNNAECVIKDIQYAVKIYDRNEMYQFIQGFFGPFS